MNVDPAQIFWGNLWWFWLAIIIVVFFKAVYGLKKSAIKGAVGEAVFGITSSLGLGDEYEKLTNIVIPASDGTTQIDQLVFSRYGIFVLEIKNFKGWIFGKKRDSRWTRVYSKSKQSFQNPLRQNYKHIKALQDLTGLPENKFKSVIVFSGEVTFRTPMPPNVVKGTGYIDYIKSFDEIILSESELRRAEALISGNRLSYEAHREYLRNQKAG